MKRRERFVPEYKRRRIDREVVAQRAAAERELAAAMAWLDSVCGRYTVAPLDQWGHVSVVGIPSIGRNGVH